MTLDESIVAEARTAREQMLDVQRDLERARADFNHAVRRLHAAGGSLREIAECLGLSHQRVHQIVEVESGREPRLGRLRRRPARPAGGDPFRRFAGDARAAVVAAQEEARALGHDWVGTEHLLLGLLRAEASGAGRALRRLGVSPEAARERVVAIVGKGGAEPKGAMPFTPRSKRVLELALREALGRGAPEIAGEHLLLALLHEGEGVAAQVLEQLGVDTAAVEAVLAEAT